MQFFMAIYFLQYLDRTLLNYAAVMGIKSHLKGNQFSDLGTIFYVGSHCEIFRFKNYLSRNSLDRKDWKIT